VFDGVVLDIQNGLSLEKIGGCMRAGLSSVVGKGMGMAALAASLLLSACQPPSADKPPADPAATSTISTTATSTPATATIATVAVVPGLDEHSYAQPDKVVVKHLALELALDFSQKTLNGTAALHLQWLDPEATTLILDSRELAVERVEGLARDGTWQPLSYTFGANDPILGSPLLIAINDAAQPSQIRLTYHTAPTASGLQWLSAEMTLGKQQPFMFSQSQQIHARSWVPLQDTTMVRFTYEAHITTPTSVMAVMSANNDPTAVRDGDYSFAMPQPIPSYLLAIAAGDLQFQAINQRAGVWAEPGMVAAAAAEFADTGTMMDTAEALYGPYRWDRYDILVLPPSFPYGGMENPRLTFATPTVIVGDKSLVSLIAHELAHSWSGNLVTFAVTRDAWLNEGITSYVENRIIESLFGKAWADMENLIERNAIAEEFTADNVALQQLAIAPGVIKDPDENLTGTVYTKGAWYMQFLEQRIGRADFDAFLRGYFDHFAFQSITSAQFADYAKANLLARYPGKVTEAEFDAWLYQPGIPNFAPATESARLTAVDTAREQWLANGQLPATTLSAAWSTQEWVHFLDGLPAQLQQTQLQALDMSYHFTGTANAELAQRWYPLTVRSAYLAAQPAMAEFLSKVGRRKLVMPIYTALSKSPEGLAFARDVFAKARPALHPITIGSVETVLGIK
jgi:leukotriene-A4 hydrolase